MRVLITGSRKGIGRFLAENYLARGYTVIGCSRGETDLHHEQYFHYKCDVAAERDVTKLIRKIRKEHGGVDVLVNNAGVASMNHILSTPNSTARRLMETNFVGMTQLCSDVAKLMIQKN